MTELLLHSQHVHSTPYGTIALVEQVPPDAIDVLKMHLVLMGGGGAGGEGGGGGEMVDVETHKTCVQIVG